MSTIIEEETHRIERPFNITYEVKFKAQYQSTSDYITLVVGNQYICLSIDEWNIAIDLMNKALKVKNNSFTLEGYVEKKSMASPERFLSTGELQKATFIVETVMKDVPIAKVKEVLEKSLEKFDDKQIQRIFGIHLNMLFLNVYLNKLDEFGLDAREKALLARTEINNIIGKQE